MAVEKVIKLKVENGEALLNVQELNKALGDTNKKTDALNDTMASATEAIDKYTGGAASGFKAMVGGVQTAIKAMGTLKGALIASGLGALVVVLGSLFTYFTQTSRGADKLSEIMGGLGAGVKVIVDRVVKFGEAIFTAFENPKKLITDFGELLKSQIVNRVTGLLELLPALATAWSQVFKGEFTQAAETATNAYGKIILGVENVVDKVGNAVGGLAKEISDEAKQGVLLEKQLDAIEDRERELIVLRSKADLERAKARSIADDETKSFEERKQAVIKAFELEQQIANEEKKNQEATVRYLKQKMALGETTDEDLLALANAQAKVNNLQEDSLKRQKKLEGELRQLDNDKKLVEEAHLARLQTMKDAEQALADARKQWALDEAAATKKRLEEERAARMQNALAFNDMLSQQLSAGRTQKENELAAAKQQYMQLLTLAIKSGKDTTQVKELYEKKKREIELRAAAKSVELVGQSFGAIAQLTEALGKGNEKNAEKTFKITKALRLAEAVANTAAAIMSQLTAGPAGFVPAAIAAATGAAQIATIAATKFQPNGGGGSSTRVSQPSIPTSTATAQPLTPNIQFGNTENQLAGLLGRPMRAYVVNQDITNANQLERRIRSSATIGG